MALEPILSELKPTAASDQTLYSANIGETATGTIFCINQSEANDKINVALVTSGNVLSNSSYLCYETIAYYGQSVYLQEIYLGSQDSIVIRSSNGSTSFTFTGYKL